MELKEMKLKHDDAITAKNWKIFITKKGLTLNSWESCSSKFQGTINYSKNFHDTFGKTSVQASRYFLYNNEYHFITSDGTVYYCPFSTRFQPGAGSKSKLEVQSKQDIAFIVKNSGIKQLEKIKNDNI